MAGSEAWPTIPTGNKDHTEAAVLIIGAGISGLCTAIDLVKRNNCKSFIILEKSGGIGGTWRDNKYPGCCCDVWSHLYSFSFEQNPDWTREYPGQEEILRYLIGVAQKHNLYQYVRFNTSVESARWDDATKQWHTTVTVQGSKDAEFGSEYTIKSDFLVSAVGQLNQPQLPDIEGLSSFKGKLMHSARWDWGYDVRGKKIAVIGNGATAAQIIPELAKEAGTLTVHQRTPNWVVPRLDAPVPEWRRAVYRYLPFIRQRKRADLMDYRESTYNAIADNEHAMARVFETYAKDLLATQLPDRPDLREKLLPKYKIGCKRIIISDDYLPVFNRENVRLETGSIEKMTAGGIVVDGTESEYDLIVLATGFRTVEFMSPISLTGSAGRTLASVWKEGGEALYGVTVESLPNFGMLYGPNTNLGHNSIILMIEAQSRYINALISEVLGARRRGGQLTIKPTESRVREYNRQLQRELEATSFNDPLCGSWYKRKDNGKITQNWSKTVVEYQKLLSTVDWSDFDLSGTGAEQLQGESGNTGGTATITEIGRVVEESLVSYRTLGITALSGVLAIGAAVAMRNRKTLRL